jgi:hypothetical protein
MGIYIDDEKFKKLKEADNLLEEIFDILGLNISKDELIESIVTINLKTIIFDYLKDLKNDKNILRDFYVDISGEYIYDLKRKVDLMYDISKEVEKKLHSL